MDEIRTPDDNFQENAVNVEPIESTETSATENMLVKLKKAAPYNIFFNIIPESAETLKQENAIAFTDLLCPSLGQLKSSLQINFMIDSTWLMEQYKERNLEEKPLTLLHGYDVPEFRESIQQLPSNVDAHFVEMKDSWGCHHAKIGIYFYEDNSLRVVVSTANLYYEDWNHYNQGLWISPRCPELAQTQRPEKSGESPTGFKFSLLCYLRHYRLPILNKWIESIKNADFSAVRVFLVTSVPGVHFPGAERCHVHHVGQLLSRHCILPTEDPPSWNIIAQSSSLGVYGTKPNGWLKKTLLKNLADYKDADNLNTTLSIVFPTVDNVTNGYFGSESGGCLSYVDTTHENQKWINDYLRQWKADETSRTRAMPHIKTYCRVSPCLSKMAWFFLTSANISKSAWGGDIQKNKSVYVRSCEAGVMFLPKFFDEEFFEISGKNQKLFPFMFDLPLTEYQSTDSPWVTKRWCQE